MFKRKEINSLKREVSNLGDRVSHLFSEINLINKQLNDQKDINNLLAEKLGYNICQEDYIAEDMSYESSPWGNNISLLRKKKVVKQRFILKKIKKIKK